MFVAYTNDCNKTGEKINTCDMKRKLLHPLIILNEMNSLLNLLNDSSFMNSNRYMINKCAKYKTVNY